jgi:hypothetical protein
MHGAEPTYITHCYKLGLPCQLRYCSKLIHPDQKGFVKGRNISEANRMIQDIIQQTPLVGAIVLAHLNNNPLVDM